MRKLIDGRLAEYPVDPAQIAVALAAKVTFDTGVLSPDTLLVRQDGVKRTVVEFRKQQKTGIFIEGSDAPIRVVLPHMILIRTTTEDKSPQYKVFAVKDRPTTLDIPLFHAPLPNVYGGGGVCWGSVKREIDLKSTSLAADWGALLGSPFGDHAVSGKSKAHPDDIRKQLLALEQRDARAYPKSDLIAGSRTLAQMLGEES